MIKNKLLNGEEFPFQEVSSSEIENKLGNLKSKKVSTWNNASTIPLLIKIYRMQNFLTNLRLHLLH